MKQLKALGLAVIVATALTTFTPVGASATYFTSPPGTVYTGVIKGESSHVVFHFQHETTCKKSKFESTVTQHGAGVTAGGPFTTLSFSECGNDAVTVIKTGSLEVHAAGSTGNADPTSVGVEVKVHTETGIVCTFKSSGTDMGAFTGGGLETSALDTSASFPVSGFLCPSKGEMTGLYNITTPVPIEVH